MAKPWAAQLSLILLLLLAVVLLVSAFVGVRPSVWVVVVLLLARLTVRLWVAISEKHIRRVASEVVVTLVVCALLVFS